MKPSQRSAILNDLVRIEYDLCRIQDDIRETAGSHANPVEVNVAFENVNKLLNKARDGLTQATNIVRGVS